jgi:hypothetical protein
MLIKGKLIDYDAADPHDRIVALSDQRALLAEGSMDTKGNWSLDLLVQPANVVAQFGGSRLGAVQYSIAEAARMSMPSFVSIQFWAIDPFEGATVRLDPIELEGYPQDLNWVLRSHPNQIVDLHVAEMPCGRDPLALQLQRGTYRLSGGTIAIRSFEKNLILYSVTNEDTGVITKAINGDVVLDVSGPSRYELSFISE